MDNKYYVYKYYINDQLLYVGRTNNFIERFKQHLRENSEYDKVTKIDIATFDSDGDMMLYEKYYIMKFHPPLNKKDTQFSSPSFELPEPQWASYSREEFDSIIPLNIRDIDIFEIGATFFNQDLTKISQALNTDTYKNILQKLIIKNKIDNADYYKYWFDYTDTNIYIIQLMPFRNKQCNHNECLYLCLDLNKKIDETLVKEVLQNYAMHCNCSNAPYVPIYYIKNYGGYKCNSYWHGIKDGYYEFQRFYIIDNL